MLQGIKNLSLPVRMVQANIDEYFARIVPQLDGDGSQVTKLEKVSEKKSYKNRFSKPVPINTKDPKDLAAFADEKLKEYLQNESVDTNTAGSLFVKEIIKDNAINKKLRTAEMFYQHEISEALEYQSRFPDYKENAKQLKYWSILEDWISFAKGKLNQPVEIITGLTENEFIAHSKALTQLPDLDSKLMYIQRNSDKHWLFNAFTYRTADGKVYKYGIDTAKYGYEIPGTYLFKKTAEELKENYSQRLNLFDKLPAQKQFDEAELAAIDQKHKTFTNKPDNAEGQAWLRGFEIAMRNLPLNISRAKGWAVSISSAANGYANASLKLMIVGKKESEITTTIKRKQKPEMENVLSDLDIIFKNPINANDCYHVLQDLELIGNTFDYIGKSKSAFCVWIQVLNKKGLIHFHGDKVYTELINNKFKGLNMSENLFRQKNTRANDKYKKEMEVSLPNP